MLQNKEYPIVDKVITSLDKTFRISVVTQEFSPEIKYERPPETCHILSAANYDEGKELRLAVWNLGRGPAGLSFNANYADNDKYDVRLAIESHDAVWSGWPTLTAHLDVRVLRFRLDNPPEKETQAVWKKQGMIADMLYLYLYPEGVTHFPLSITTFDGVQGRSLKYEARREWFLRNPELFISREG